MVSIIIATYNSEKTLRRAMESVLAQSYQNWECIVVDGASKDSTLSIVKEFVERDARFRYISEPDHGIYDAFNKGWKMAKGEWVMYLGSDDEYTQDGIQTLMESSGGADVVYGDIYLKYLNGRIKVQKGQIPDFCGTSAFCGHQAVAMKRTVILAMNGFDMNFKLLADWDLIRRSGQKGYKYKYVNCLVAYFSVGGASSNNYAATIEAFSVYRKTNNLCVCYMTLLYRLTRKFFIIQKSRYFI